MSKKQNKRIETKKIRHILNRSMEFFHKVSGHKLDTIHYGGGLTKNSIIEKEIQD